MPIINIIDNRWAETELEGADDIRRLLRFKVPGYQFVASFQQGQWDGYKHLTRQRRAQGVLRIPIGLVELVTDSPLGSKYRVVDSRTKPTQQLSPYGMAAKQLIKLDPHQEAAVQAGVEADMGIGIIKYPTGTGKGRILGETARRLNLPTLILCNSKDLLHKLSAEVAEATSTFVGEIGDGKWDVGNFVTVATVQSLAPKLDENTKQAKQNPARFKLDMKDTVQLLELFYAVLVDECKHVTANQYQVVLEHMKNAYHRIGFDATPFKSYKEGKALDKGQMLQTMASLGPPRASLSLSEALDTGRVVPTNVYMVSGISWDYPKAKTPDPLDDPDTLMNFPNELRWGILENPKRNATILNLIRKLPGQTVVLVGRIDHGKYLQDQLNRQMAGTLTANERTPLITGSTKTAERDHHYTRFRNGHLNTLIIGKLGEEALDLANIDNLILAGGGKADHTTLQKLGRAMRAADGKSESFVFDFLDEGKFIGAHARRRRRLYEGEEAFTFVEIDASEL